MDTIGSRLKRERIRLGWSQAQLAKRSGVGASTIADLETNPNRATTKLSQLAKALGVNPLWLESGKGSKTPPADPTVQYVAASSMDELAIQLIAKGDAEIAALIQRILELKSRK